VLWYRGGLVFEAHRLLYHSTDVDVNTQAMYQQLDSAFVGLIFSCFNAGLVVPGVPTGTQALLQDGASHGFDGMMVSMGKTEGVGRVQVPPSSVTIMTIKGM